MNITNEQIDRVFDSMPNGAYGFLRQWGYQQFARRILSLRAMPLWEPEFDAISPNQEELSVEFCHEIAECGVDPVRLLEMAQALYQAEKNDKLGMEIVK